MLAFAASAQAQSTVSPQSDWNGNYGFSSSTDQNLRILRADIIRKSEEGYYESLGKAPVYNVSNVSTTEVNTVNNSTTEIGQQTTAIGSVNSSTTRIDIADSADVDISTQSTSDSAGCQDASVRIENTGLGPSSTACN